ncbi:hypothetical protein V2J09_012163 [Rumex salicifolius]
MDVIKTQQISSRPIEKVIVHPLVLLSIVDHYNRVARDTRKRVVGVLLGSTFKGTVDVSNSYAVPFEEDDKDPSIWFLDHNYHEAMFSIYVPNPVLVIIDVQPVELGIPTKAYCTVEEVKENATQKSQKVFVHVLSEIAAHEVEEIGVEHLLRDVKDTTISTLATEVSGKLVALKGLDARLREIRSYLDLVIDEKLPLNHEILYHLQDVFNLLPNLNVSELINAFAVKTNDMMLVIYLSSVIRSVIALHNLINNKMLNKEHEKAEDSKPVSVPAAAGIRCDSGPPSAPPKINFSRSPAHAFALADHLHSRAQAPSSPANQVTLSLSLTGAIIMSDALVNGLAGAGGGIIAQLITYPLQTVNTRQQTERDPEKEKSNLGAIERMCQVIKHEGWGRLYGGLAPSLIGTAASQGVYYYFYQIFRNKAEVVAINRKKKGAGDGSVGMFSSLLVAALSGCVNVLMTNPIWVVVTRMQTHTKVSKKLEQNQTPSNPDEISVAAIEPLSYGTSNAIQDLYGEAGFLGFWKGVFPTLIMVSNPSMQFMLYETMLKNLRRRRASTKNEVTALELQFVSFMQSRLQAKQVTSADKRHNYKGTSDAIMKMIQYEGLSGFYKGMSTKIVQSVLAAAILFMIKEELVKGARLLLSKDTRSALK